MATHSRTQSIKSKTPWFERFMAILALVNFGLVVFDVSYVRFRDLYLRQFPAFTQWYGYRFKAIKPERSTKAYLETVVALEAQVAQAGLRSPESRMLLADLQKRSAEMIDENPFQVANKSGTLERIKNLMRDRVRQESSKQAFQTFWSEDYLTKVGWSTAINFFRTRIKPLMNTNYFRPIGEDGDPIDRFWQIDLWFIAIFGVEFLARTVYLTRRYRSITWLDAALWRWYDLFLLIPFSLIPVWGWVRLLRIIPVTVRLSQASLVNLNPLQQRISRSFVTHFAIELTEVVVLRVIDQVQNLIREGQIVSWLLQSDSRRRYIDLNGVDEITVLSQRLISSLVNQVLPKIKPEVDALLHHSVVSALNQSPVYKNLRVIPGVETVSDQLTQQIVAEVTQNLYKAVTAALQDPVGVELTRKLIDSLGDALRTEAQQARNTKEIQTLVADLLDEVKINYVSQIAAEDVDKLQQKTYQIYEATQQRQN
jgi:hypothetical protein